MRWRFGEVDEIKRKKGILDRGRLYTTLKRVPIQHRRVDLIFEVPILSNRQNKWLNRVHGSGHGPSLVCELLTPLINYVFYNDFFLVC